MVTTPWHVMAPQRTYHVCRCGGWIWASKVALQLWQEVPSPSHSAAPPEAAEAGQLAAGQGQEEDSRLQRAVGTVWDLIPAERFSSIQTYFSEEVKDLRSPQPTAPGAAQPDSASRGAKPPSLA